MKVPSLADHPFFAHTHIFYSWIKTVILIRRLKPDNWTAVSPVISPLGIIYQTNRWKKFHEQVQGHGERRLPAQEQHSGSTKPQLSIYIYLSRSQHQFDNHQHQTKRHQQGSSSQPASGPNKTSPSGRFLLPLPTVQFIRCPYALKKEGGGGIVAAPTHLVVASEYVTISSHSRQESHEWGSTGSKRECSNYL